MTNRPSKITVHSDPKAPAPQPLGRQVARDQLAAVVRDTVTSTPIVDIHTHLFAPQFGDLLLWGIDELLTYHYLVAELFRAAPSDLTYEQFWALDKTSQADLVWRELFVSRTPISEAARGVVHCLRALGYDTAPGALEDIRHACAESTVEEHLDRVLAASNVQTVVMTNDPFDLDERPCWETAASYDERFRPVLRLDKLIVFWDDAVTLLQEDGYQVEPDLSGSTFDEIERWLEHWIECMQPIYLAASLPPDFKFPSDSRSSRILAEVVLPTAARLNKPFAWMWGCRRQVNPNLWLAGDGVARTDMDAVTRLCAAFPEVRFLGTILSRENQHELVVLARKFRNLHVFGCWWFLNTPSLVEEMTRMRVELLGHTFTPQHSDARVLDQLIYKWGDSKKVIANVLVDKYAALADEGWPITVNQIEREVADLFGAAAMRFILDEKREGK